MPSRLKSEIWATLPPEPAADCVAPTRKAIVLDDDPTGTQTVHGIPVLTRWTVNDLRAELADPAPCCYLLTNTRAFSAAEAARINREIGRNLKAAEAAAGRGCTLISRSDSTLRGHYPAETDALAEAVGPAFDGTLLVPAFCAGGRYTVGDVHYVAQGDWLTPVGETEFASDPNFGFRSSNLRDYVAEKTGGRVRPEDVVSIGLDDLRIGGAGAAAARLAALPRGGVAFANVAAPGDLAVLTRGLQQLERAGRRYLYRTAADFVAAYAAIVPRPLLSPAELRRPGLASGGLLVAGSHVGRTGEQLAALFQTLPEIAQVKISLPALLDPGRRTGEISRCAQAVEEHLAAGRDAVLYRIGAAVEGRDAGESLAWAAIISSSLVAIVGQLKTEPRWLIAKGGITSSDLATAALGVRRAIVLGQAQPGVPVWQTGPESRWPGAAYIIYPGNVGDTPALARLVESLQRGI